MYLKELFRQADKNHSGTLNLKECTELITNFLHVKTKKDLNQLFNEADFDKTGKFIHAKYYKHLNEAAQHFRAYRNGEHINDTYIKVF